MTIFFPLLSRPEREGGCQSTYFNKWKERGFDGEGAGQNNKYSNDDKRSERTEEWILEQNLKENTQTQNIMQAHKTKILGPPKRRFWKTLCSLSI